MYTLGAMPGAWRRTLAAPTIVTIVGVLILGAATSAWAHVRPTAVADASLTEAPKRVLDAPTWPEHPLALNTGAAAPPAPATLALTVVLTLALGLGIVAPRRTLVVALLFVLGVLSVETGVHSVHHLADRQAAADCAVASATAHVHGVTQVTAPDAIWVATPIGLAPLLAVDRLARRPGRPDAGRAPPAA
jgi:hypothetical protein